MKTSLPIEHKARIRQLYLRFRDLAHEVRAAKSTLNITCTVFWIALFALVVWAVKLFIGRELPGALGGFGLIGTPVAWLYLKEVRAKVRSLLREGEEIKRELEIYGAFVSDTPGAIRMYVRSFSDEVLIDPFSDTTYG